MDKEKDKLTSLFEQARNQELSTSHSEVGAWIGYFSLAALLAAWLTKFKVLFTKTYFMYTAVLLSAGIGAGIFFHPSNTPQVVEKRTKKSKIAVEKPEALIQTSSPQIQFSPKKQILPFVPITEADLVMDDPFPLQKVDTTDEPFENVMPPVAQSVSSPATYKDYGTFTKIVVSDAMRVVLVQEGVQGVRLAEGTDESQVSITNKSGTLRISQQSSRNNKEVKVYISITDINSLVVSDASRVLSESSTLSLDNIDISCSDASRVELNLHAKKVSFRCSDASRFTVSGMADNLDIVCSDASRISAFDFVCKFVDVTGSDASRIEVHATESLNVKVKDATRVEYKGKPKTFNQESKIPSRVESVE